MTSCSELCGSDHGERSQSTVHNHHQHYGVRSYLHHFYEECTASIWDRDEDFQIQKSPSRWSAILGKVCLAFGTLMLVVGLTVLTVGFAAPPKIEAFGEEELLFVDKRAAHFNRALEVCKLVGGVLFCAGGVLAAAGLLLSSFTRGEPSEERCLQRRFKEKLAELQAAVHPIRKAPTLGEWRIPVTLSKAQNIQPVSET
ncbi:neurensin-1 [Anguilla anguilla]|uniref:neurensin-1 n=1 Tax=Anguilla anguilla TaxID=7936 RepID=UPI0015AB7FBC|nr:neurensin-1 [Anguilla anguilla]XP_035262973.1 neurensin-1 [Anguilla anguilla]